MRNTTISLIIIAVLAAIAVYIVLPVPHPDWLVRSDAAGKPTPLELKLGLDLQGGTQVMLEAVVPEGRELQPGAMDTAKNIVERRVNGLGVSEAVVQSQGETRITAELPGITNPDQAIETIRSTGQLEFVNTLGEFMPQGTIINTTNKPEAVQNYLAGAGADPTVTPFGERVFTTAMTGDVLRTAVARQDQFGLWEIGFELTGPGSDQFFAYTSANLGQPMAIVLDGVVLSTPVIQAAIRDQGVITGEFSEAEANSLAIQMRYGALPVPLQVVDVRSISATLGQDSVNSSLLAGIIGMTAVFLFMVLMYRVPGLLANLALLIYVFFNLAIYKLVPVTLTLAGITGFLLSVGMAVDANILIFERLREEMRGGRSPRLAVEAGFSRAWPAIFDSNLTTLISCAVLYVFGNQFGASIVKGYALTLGVGVLLSMFTAFFITRTFMRALLGNRTQSAKSAQTIVGY